MWSRPYAGIARTRSALILMALASGAAGFASSHRPAASVRARP